VSALLKGRNEPARYQDKHSVKDLVRQGAGFSETAGVNRSTFYRNYDSKDAIIKYYFNCIIYRFVEKAPENPIPSREYFSQMFQHYYDYKRELLLIHKAGLTRIVLDTLNETFSEIHADITKTERYATYYHTGGIYNSFLLWFEGGITETPAEMAAIVTSFFPEDFKPYLFV